jgi:hypothetical protein
MTVLGRSGSRRRTLRRSRRWSAPSSSVSGKAAASIYARLRDTVTAPLTPSKVLALRSQSLTKAGLSKAKAQTIRELAGWFAANRKQAKALPTLSDAEIVETLTALPGIGVWTVNVFLIFNLGTEIPSGSAIATIAFVIWMSACDGEGSPDGCGCGSGR